MKTKSSTKPIFLLLLIQSALWLSGCSSECPTDCDFKLIDKVGIDTIYYPYVTDFEVDGKIYTYEITVDGRKFIRSYEMTQFEHKIKHEYNRIWPDGEDCPSLECRTKTEGFYEMVCKEISGSEFESAIYQVRRDAFYYQFYGGEYFYRDGIEGYPLSFNLNQVDTFDSYIKSNKEWYEHFEFNGKEYAGVTTITHFEDNGDTIWHEAYNKNNGIIHLVRNEKQKKNEIKLLNIE